MDSAVPHKDFVEVMGDFEVPPLHRDSVVVVNRESVAHRTDFPPNQRTHSWVEVCLAVDYQQMDLVPG